MADDLVHGDELEEAAVFSPLHPVFADAPDSVTFRKLRKRLVRETQGSDSRFRDGERGQARNGKRPRWLVCLSGARTATPCSPCCSTCSGRGAAGGSARLQSRSGQPGFPKHILPEYLARVGVPYKIITQDTYSVVTEKVPASNTYCSLCSRMRRGILYRVAREEGCEAVVLGHHRDDSLETFMLNFLHGGRLAAMPPKLVNDAGDLFVLRPLIGCAEDDIRRFAAQMQFPIIPCNLCGSQDGLQRMQIKSLLNDWEQRSPGKRQVMARALSHVRPSHLVDAELFDFAGLELGSPGMKDDGL